MSHVEGPRLEFAFITHISFPSNTEEGSIHNSCFKSGVCLCSPASPTPEILTKCSFLCYLSPLSTFSHLLHAQPSWRASSMPHPPPAGLLLRALSSLKPCQGHQLRGVPLRSEEDSHHLCHPPTLNVSVWFHFLVIRYLEGEPQFAHLQNRDNTTSRTGGFLKAVAAPGTLPALWSLVNVY